MMTLVRWHRAQDLPAISNEMTRLMHGFIHGGRHNNGGGRGGFWTPAVDIYEGDEAFTVKAELPGFSTDDVQVEMKDDQLILKGKRTHESGVKEAKYHRV